MLFVQSNDASRASLLHGGCHLGFLRLFRRSQTDFGQKIMPFAEADYLPSYEELTVPELNMTAAPLRAGAVYFGKYCDEQCKVKPLFIFHFFCCCCFICSFSNQSKSNSLLLLALAPRDLGRSGSALSGPVKGV